jgi:hypothetical protein
MGCPVTKGPNGAVSVPFTSAVERPKRLPIARDGCPPKPASLGPFGAERFAKFQHDMRVGQQNGLA